MIPLISSMCRGPLGVCQLPRTWWKVTLRANGLLDSAYPDCSRELDDWCLNALELDKEKTLDYVRNVRPTYLEFENWVLDQKGGKLDQARIDRWNDGVEKRVHVNPRKIEETYPDIGFDMSEVRVTSAVILNCMQDWGLFHKNDLMSGTFDLKAPVVPLISSIDFGQLRVMQLPRTWLKVLLNARNLLLPDYPDCGGGLDQNVLDALGLDRDRTLGYLRTELPSYTQFESYILGQTNGQIDHDKVQEFHTFMLNRVHPDKKRADIHNTIGKEEDGTLTNGVLLNHLEDWALAHKALGLGTGG